jgi:hypothetical protein
MSYIEEKLLYVHNVGYVFVFFLLRKMEMQWGIAEKYFNWVFNLSGGVTLAFSSRWLLWLIGAVIMTFPITEFLFGLVYNTCMQLFSYKLRP